MDGTDKRDKIMPQEELSVEIRIRRSAVDPRSDSQVSIYKLRFYEGMTLHQALQQVYRTEDASLAFRPFHCGKGTCMSCLISVNGKRKQACAMLLNPGERVFVEPDHSRPLVRDLVTIPLGTESKSTKK